MVPPCNKSPNFPSHPSISFDQQHHGPGALILCERFGVIGRDRNAVAVDVRGPNVDVFVALIGGWDLRTECDLLVAVNGIDIELVVVDADLVVWVARREGDLEAGGEEVGGDVEGVNGGVLEDEFWFCGLEYGPD